MSRFVMPGIVAALLVIPTSLLAQDRSEKVRIPTVDSVELIGNFYGCTNGKIKNPPVVLMLHPLGESSSKKDWVGLAETLQSKFAVMTFDFRGHGNSTEVLPETFWNSRTFGANTLAGKDGASSISFKEFDKKYYPVLINDIAAVKCWLDRKNDSGACNTSNMILLGAGDGATLGAIWLSSEWHRFKLVQNPVNLLMMPDNRAEANDYIGAVWLGISPSLGGRTVGLTSQLEMSLKQKATPMAFVHSDDDEKGKTVANSLAKTVKGLKDKEKYALTVRVGVPKAGKLTGSGLLQKSLGTSGAVLDYLEKVVDAKGREWGEREFNKTNYCWRMSLNIPTFTPAKQLNDKNLVFDTYTKFIK